MYDAFEQSFQNLFWMLKFIFFSLKEEDLYKLKISYFFLILSFGNVIHLLFPYLLIYFSLSGDWPVIFLFTFGRLRALQIDADKIKYHYHEKVKRKE